MNKKKKKIVNTINNYADSLRRHKKEISEYKKYEREEYKKIKDYEIGEKVLITNKSYKNTNIETVLKIYDKTYKISYGINDYVLIDKKNLTGYSNSLIKEPTGDGRRYIGSTLYLSKIEK